MSPASRWKVIGLKSWIVLSILEVHLVEMAVLMLKFLKEQRKPALLLLNWRNEYGLIAVLQQTPKLSVYEACVLPILLYGSETWTTYRHHVNLLERFHQKCIHRILNVKWRSYTPDTVVLERACSTSIEKRLLLN